MRKYILTVLSVLFVLSACMKENLEPSTNGGNLKEFTAKFESNASKTTLDGYDVYWSKGDAIAVFAPDGTKAKFTIDEQSIDGQSARFVGTIKDAAEYVAVYPYSAADSYDGSRITFTTPSVQTAVTGGFGNGSNVAIAAPSQKDFQFKNATTLLKVNVKRSDVAKIVISTSGSVPVSGTYTLTPKVTEITASNIGKTVTISAASGNLAAGLYYIPVPYTTAKLSDLNLSLQNASGTEVTSKKFDPGFMLYRNRICVLGDFGTGISCAQDLVDFAAAVNSGKSTTAWQTNGEVVLLNNIDMSDVTSWTPIGNAAITYNGYTTVSVASGYAFTGKFNGNGYSITNLTMKNASATKPCGLFGLLSGATVKNVNLGTPSDNSSIYVKTTARNNVGAICGISSNSYIENCKNYAPITIGGTSSSTMFSIGGITGYHTGSGTAAYAVKNCENYGTINVSCGTNQANGSAGVQVGGISGFSASATTATTNAILDGCKNYGEINANCGRVSGLTPVLMYCDAKNCINYGAITSTLTSALVAGLVSFQTYNAVMTDCWNYGSVLMQGDGSYGAGMVANLNDQITSGTHKAQITGGGNRGTVVYPQTLRQATDVHQLVSVFTAGHFNKVDNVIAGGRVGYYNINKEIQYYNITSSNYMTYAIATATNVTNIKYEGASVGGISTLAEFQDFANLVNNGESTWKYEDEQGYVNLKADIDMAGVSNWTPIGMPANYTPDIYFPSYTGASFKGKFNGNGHTIKNLKLSTNGDSAVYGLFGVVRGATIKNLVLGTGADASIFNVGSEGAMDAGVLAGCVIDSKLSDITNNVPIKTTGVASQEKMTIGGIAGFVTNSGEALSSLDALRNNASISGQSGNSSNGMNTSVQIGGIVGFASAHADSDEVNTLLNSNNYGEITAQGGRVGGIVATAIATEVSKNTNYGEINNTQVNARAAGIVAVMAQQSSMANCVNEGNVTTTQASGECAGLVANLAHTSITVSGGGNYGVITTKKTDNRGVLCAKVTQLSSMTGVVVGGSLFCNGVEQELTKANYVSYSYNTGISSTNAAKITDLIYDGEKVGIRTAEELVELATLVNSGKDYSKFVNESGAIVLLKDIDMSSVKNWTPIGYASLSAMTSGKALTVSAGYAFKGTFDGDAHVIKGLKMVAPAGETAIRPYGLFGVVAEGSVIQNFQFDEDCSLTINSTKGCAVGMAAGMVIASQVRDISVFGPTTFQPQTTETVVAAPLVGALWSSQTGGCVMDSCHNYGKITALNKNNVTEVYSPLPPNPSLVKGYMVGGLVGLMDGYFGSSTDYKTNMLSDSSNKGDIESAIFRTGGIIGTICRQSTASNCINDGNIRVTASSGAHVGGISSLLFSYCNLTGCRNMGNIICTNRAYAGGLLGSVPSGGRKMSLCSNYGVIITDSDYRGVFWAYNGKTAARTITYENCVAAGNLGKYNGGTYTYDVLEEANKARYLGYDYKVETMKLTDVVYKIGVTSPSGGSSAGLKILCIGNSFTQDAMWQVPNICAGFGIKDVKFCQMYYGGRVLEAYNNGWSSSSDYTAYIYEAGSTVQKVQNNQNLAVMAASEEWDMVTIMEHTGSYHSWFWTAAEKAAIQGLIDKVKKTQAGVPKFYYIMSQSYWDMGKIPAASKKYAPGGEEQLFANRQGQHAVTCTQAQKVMEEITDFEGLVAAGTALENLRTTSVCKAHSLGLTRDGYHMDKGIARYAAGCVMYQVMLYPIYKKELSANTFRDATTSTTTGQLQTAITNTNAPIAQQAALFAVSDPYKITDMSTY